MIDIDSVLLGEYAENEVRKDFTVSERVEIAKAVEAELGNRRGQRTDLELVVNCPQVQGEKTRDIAAKKSGFGSSKTYERAKKVVDNATPELVEAMDEGRIWNFRKILRKLKARKPVI